MRALILLLLLVSTYPLLAQPVKIEFVVQSEITTELTSVTDIHVMTTHGAYNFNEIKIMTFWGVAPDSATIALLRNNGIGVYLKTKYLKPNSAKSGAAWEARVKGAITSNDSIWMKGTSYWHGSVRMSPRGALTLLESNPGSHDEAEKARANLNARRIVYFVGGAMMAWPVVQQLLGTDGKQLLGYDEPQWAFAAGGAAIILGGGIPLTIGFRKHTEKAIKVYNGRTPSSGRSGVSIKFFPSIYGGTLLVKF